MPPNVSLISDPTVAGRFRQNDADRLSRETQELALSQSREAGNRTTALDAASASAVRRGGNLQENFAQEAASRGLGQEAFAAASGAATAQTERETAKFDSFMDAVGAGDIPGALLRAGPDITPNMERALADVNFRQGLTQLWAENKVIYKNQPQALAQAMAQGTQQLLAARGRGETSPVTDLQRPPAAAVTPNISSGAQNQFFTGSDGRVFRVNKQGGPATPVGTGVVNEETGQEVPFRTGDPNADRMQELEQELKLRQLATDRAEADPTSFTVNQFDGGREKDPVKFAENVAAHFEALQRQSGLGPAQRAFPSGNPDAIPEPTQPSTPAAAPQPQQLPTPQTQADFDAILSGSLYIDPDDGKFYIKP